MKRSLAQAVVVAFLAALPASAQQQNETGIQVEDAWARASAGAGKTAAAYMTLTNDGDAADRLVAIETKAAGTAELHGHENDNGIMRMRPVDGIDLPAGESVVLKPGGLHVMLMELRQPLREGDQFPLILTFEKAGETTVEVDVLKLGASGPHDDAHTNHQNGQGHHAH